MLAVISKYLGYYCDPALSIHVEGDAGQDRATTLVHVRPRFGGSDPLCTSVFKRLCPLARIGMTATREGGNDAPGSAVFVRRWLKSDQHSPIQVQRRRIRQIQPKPTSSFAAILPITPALLCQDWNT
jgi:hypothetical protein